MKNQYFGDINDYKKFGLLRLLSGYGKINLGICWMLTPDDDRSDGELTKYLNEAKYWREFDQELFDCLRYHVYIKKERNIKIIEKSNIIPGAICFSEILPDKSEGRQEYFKKMKSVFKNCDLVFFDPDNGIEVKSKPYGSKGCSKYSYWRELVPLFTAGHSLLIYQHFPRVSRDQFIETISSELKSRTGVSKVYCIYTTHVLFLLIPQEKHEAFFLDRLQQLPSKWGIKMKLFTDNHKYSDQHSFDWSASESKLQ